MRTEDLRPLTHEEPVLLPLYWREVPEVFDREALIEGMVIGGALGLCLWVLIFAVVWWL